MLKVQISATHGKGLVIPYGSFSGENWLEIVARSPHEEQASRAYHRLACLKELFLNSP
jgi:hypothetical protein